MDVDLNLMRPLCALLEERHVSRAAERCGVTQPAMSRTFERLRETFGDELLVRSGRRYERTPRGEQLLNEMREILERVDAAIAGDRFDPARSDASFRIATTDYVSAILVPHLLHDMEQQAPLSTLDIHMADDRTFDELIAGRIDAALVGIGEPSSMLRREKLFEDGYMCVVGANHTVKRSRFLLSEYLAQRHVVIDVEHGLQPPIDKPLEMLGTRRRIGYRTPFLTSAAYAVSTTSMVLTIPSRLAELVVKDVAVRTVEAPRELSSFTYSIVWHPRLDASAPHAWFCDRIRVVAKRVLNAKELKRASK